MCHTKERFHTYENSLTTKINKTKSEFKKIFIDLMNTLMLLLFYSRTQSRH